MKQFLIGILAVWIFAVFLLLELFAYSDRIHEAEIKSVSVKAVEIGWREAKLGWSLDQATNDIANFLKP